MVKTSHGIAVFGGTFDPPHNGHFTLADNILRHDFADEVMFVPALHPPHKTAISNSPFEDRRRMLQLGIGACGERCFSLNNLEGERRDAPSYTYDTMRELSGVYVDAELVLLLGADSLITLHSWYRAADIVSGWKILTYPRSGFDSFSELSDFWPAGIASQLAETILPFEMCDVSSTEIREKIQRGADVSSMLSPEICKYIKKRGLYKRG